MAHIIEGGGCRGFKSKIPIEMIQNYVFKLFHYKSCGTCYGDYSANINFNFSKYKEFSFNKNFSFKKPLSWFKEPPFGYFEKSVDEKKIIEKIQAFLISKGYNNIYSELNGTEFSFKILTEKEKKIKIIQNNIDNF
jgi:hypothetical protein